MQARMISGVRLFLVLLCSVAVVGLGVALTPSQPLEAQVVQDMNALASPSVELSPRYPTPGQSVTATFKAYGINLNVSNVVWKHNGVVVAEGQGLISHTFTAGLVGSRTVINVTATDFNGKSVFGSTILTMNEVMLVWEAATYVPPLYRGRALPVAGGDVRVMVLPTVFGAGGAPYDPSALLYEWWVADARAPLETGIGKTSTIVRAGRRTQSMRVTVKIQDPAGNGLATQYIDIPPSEPKILFYNDDPLVGVEYDHALTKKQPIASQEMTLIAEPYYIQAGSRTAPELEYQWNVGGSQETNPGSIILRPSGEGEGEARIQLILTAGGNASARLRGELTFTFSAGGAAATQTGPETIAL